MKPKAKRVKTVKAEERALDPENFTSAEYKALTGLFAPPTLSKVTVNEQTALGISSLWCGIRVISQDVGSLEPILYRETGDQREPFKDDPRYRLLLEEPNPEMTRPVFFETIMAHALLGNGYAEVERNNAGEPIALWPVHPCNVNVARDNSGGIVYEIYTPSGNAAIPAADMIHIPGLSPDGSVGYKLLEVARETLGFGIATQRYGSAFFGNSARPSGVLTVQGDLTDPTRVENLRKSWGQNHTGVDNVGRPAILATGDTFTPFPLTNEQSQYSELLKYFTYQVAQLLCIPPSKLFDLQKATWGNLETLNQDYLTSCLRPWLLKIEAELLRKLFRVDERRDLFIEFDTVQLLRADITSRFNAYKIAIDSKFLTVDECRARENLPPTKDQAPAPTDTTTTNNQPANDQAAAVDTSIPVTAAPVADSGLNGAQVASLLAIVDKVATKQYPPLAAIALIKASFPLMSESEVTAIVNSVAAFDAPTPAPTPAPIQGGINGN
jgi:HK97 family phage portal protein